MDNDILYNAIAKYFKTLKNIGYISQKETIRLLILSFLNDYIDSLSAMDNRIYDVFKCLYRGSCVIDKRIGCVVITNPEGDNDSFTYTFNFNLG